MSVILHTYTLTCMYRYIQTYRVTPFKSRKHNSRSLLRFGGPGKQIKNCLGLKPNSEKPCLFIVSGFLEVCPNLSLQLPVRFNILVSIAGAGIFGQCQKDKGFCLRNSSVLTARAILEKNIFLKDRFLYIESRDLLERLISK